MSEKTDYAVMPREELIKQLEQYDDMFDLQWAASMRGIKRWQAQTGKHLTWPDEADFTYWLLMRLEAAEKVIDAGRPLGSSFVSRENVTEEEATAFAVVCETLLYDEAYPPAVNTESN